MLTEREIMTDFPRTPGQFSLTVRNGDIHLWTFQNILWKQTMWYFYLLTNWTKHKMYKNPKGKRKLIIKYKICVALTVHMKGFSKNCWKNAILSKYTTKGARETIVSKADIGE